MKYELIPISEYKAAQHVETLNWDVTWVGSPRRGWPSVRYASISEKNVVVGCVESGDPVTYSPFRFDGKLTPLENPDPSVRLQPLGISHYNGGEEIIGRREDLWTPVRWSNGAISNPLAPSASYDSFVCYAISSNGYEAGT